jgi:F-type H+-transporting ATPase subunit epsilon
MKLKILLPFQVFADKQKVSRIVAKTASGSIGLLPRRLDCTAALVPGILTYETEADGEVFVAVDQGVLVKIGSDVLVSVRNAIGGKNLEQLHAAVEQEFLALDERELSVRSVMAKMESGFIQRFVAFHNEN